MSTDQTTRSPSDRLGRLPSSRLADYDLSVPQVQALEALITGATVTKAAEAADVHRATVHRWRREDPDFQAALSGLRHGLRQRVLDRLLSAADQAAEVVAREVTEEENLQAAVRLLRGLGLLNGSEPEFGETAPAVRRADQAVAEQQLRAFLERLDELDPAGADGEGSLLEVLADGFMAALEEHSESASDARLLEGLREAAEERGVIADGEDARHNGSTGR